MAAYFFDSSALVKRFANEKGTVWVINLFRRTPPNAYYAARITFVEVSSSLARKLRSDEIKSDSESKTFRRLRRIFDSGIENIEISPSLIRYSADLARKHLLRAYDAVQLAAALEVSFERTDASLSELIFVCADNALNKAALAEGLTVQNPNDHS